MSYSVVVAPSPAKFLEKLRDESLKRRIFKALQALENNPRPSGCIRLQGPDDLHRIRVGDYRIVYEIQDAVLVVLVLKIGNRREVYRR